MTSLLSGPGAPNSEAQADPRDAMAARLYPAAAPAPQPTAINAEVAAVRAADPARAFYSPESNYGSSLTDLAQAIVPEGNAAHLTELGVELGSILADIDLTRADLDRMAVLVRQRVAKPFSAAEAAAERREAIAQLRQTYREPGAFDAAVTAAQNLAQRDPRLQGFIQHAGIQQNAWFVSRMAELGLRSRTRR